MIRINQLKLPPGHSRQDLIAKVSALLGVAESELHEVRIIKQSVDARKKPDIFYSYGVDVTVNRTEGRKEEKLVRRLKNRDVSLAEEPHYLLPKPGTEDLCHPPVIIGTGPAGLFCGLMLARMGYRPVLLERGEDVDARAGRVAGFWAGEDLHPDSNVQFGEGGAGTFSDGKLNTLVKDPFGRNREVLKIFAEFGADPSILYVNKPHVGTDVLSRIVKAMREEIKRLGGQVRFLNKVTDFIVEEGRLRAVIVNGRDRVDTSVLVAAMGHSARDTFKALWERGIPMEAKAFAVGLRVQHPQTLINLSQYAAPECPKLGPASYKVAGKSSGGRGVYSFCMCPGGYVVNASSEPGRLAVNGMSYHDRAGENANSALIVTVGPEDFPHTGGSPLALAGIEFQRRLEEKAFRLGGGSIPVQLYGDFKENKISTAFGEVRPACKGRYAFANLRELLPDELSGAIIRGMADFGRSIRGFDLPDAILAGVESRTSSPVRIPRDGNMESMVKGLFPCGEGAGYAGGITSAAMDGLRVAEEITGRYRPLVTPC